MSPRPPGWRRAERPAAALALALAPAGPPAAAEAPDSARRIIAVGDIHGAYNGVREILRKVGLIDLKDHWTGGDAVLVQTGDFLDRGPGATQVAQLLMELQKTAPRHGGEVIVLLGNHEVLNLLGDLRDVTKYILRHHVDKHSEKRLTVSCNDYAAFFRRLYELKREKPPARRELVDRCLAERRLGLMEYLEEIGPRGEIGRWLRRLPTAVEVDGVVFVHGGISPELADRDLDEINREVRREIKSYDFTRQYLIDQRLILPTSTMGDVLAVARQLAKATSGSPSLPPLAAEFLHVLQFESWLLVREDGPFWFRGYARWSEEEGRPQIASILDSLKAEHVVVGHTPQPPFVIRQRFDSRVFLIDTGMLTSFYKGTPSALEIEGGSFTARYLTKQYVLYEPRAVAMTR